MTDERESLLKHIISKGFVRSKKVIDAFRNVDRRSFLSSDSQNDAYLNQPLYIGFGQTISAPDIVCLMTELLEPDKDDIVLEVGSGSGYQAAILSRIVKKVYTTEIDPRLARLAEENLKKAGCGNVEVMAGDGSEGYAKKAPFDKIIITCAAPDIPPKLIEQLKIGGRLVAPVGKGYYQELLLCIKTEKGVKNENYGGCIFVPLRHNIDDL